MLQRPLGSSTPKTRSPPPPLSSAQGPRQGKIKSVNAIGQGEGGGRARLHTWWGSSEATATATCAKNEPVAMGGHLCEPEVDTVQRHARGVLRAGGNAGRPGQSSGAVFHYDYTARRFFTRQPSHTSSAAAQRSSCRPTMRSVAAAQRRKPLPCPSQCCDSAALLRRSGPIGLHHESNSGRWRQRHGPPCSPEVEARLQEFPPFLVGHNPPYCRRTT